MLKYIRHAEQTTHRILDPPIILSKAHSSTQEEYDYIIVSPYLRTRQTANFLNTSNKPMYVDVRISEFGGCHPQKHAQKFHESSLAWGVPPASTETWAEFTKRVDEHFEDMKKLSTDRVLVVTHGIVVKYMEEKIHGFSVYKRGRDVPFLSGITIRE